MPSETSPSHRTLQECIFKKGGVKWDSQTKHSTTGRALYHTENCFSGSIRKTTLFKGSLRLGKGVSCHGSSFGRHSFLLLKLQISTKFSILLLQVTSSSSQACCKGKSLLKMMEAQPEKKKSECAGAATSFWHPLLAPKPGGAGCQEKRSKLCELEML